MRHFALIFTASFAFAATTLAQVPPYENPLPVDPPYYRVRYEASSAPDQLPESLMIFT